MAVHPNFFSRIPVLAALPEAVRLELAGHARLRELARRAVAQDKGRSGQGLGFVLDGRLQGVDFTRDGREVGLYFVGPGDFYGELSAIDGAAAPEYVIASTKCLVLELAEADVQQRLLPAPGAAAAIARRLARRVREGIRQRTLLALGSPQQRLAALLTELAATDGRIAHAPTHQELAIMINTTRETVTRLFQSLQQQGWIARDGDTLLIRQAEALAALVQGSRQ